MNRVQEVVDYAHGRGLYVILNVHHDTGGEGWLKASAQDVAEDTEKFIALWRQIANRFKDYDNHLLFEGFNEILSLDNNWGYPGKEANNAVNHFNQTFVSTVRETGGSNAERILIVTTYAAQSDRRILTDFVLPEDLTPGQLIVQVHFYNPNSYCFSYDDGYRQTSWQGGKAKAAIDTLMQDLHSIFTSKGTPVIIGEFAAAAKNNEADRAEWAGYLVGQARLYGIRCVWWDGGAQMNEDLTLDRSMTLIDRFRLTLPFPQIIDAMKDAVVGE